MDDANLLLTVDNVHPNIPIDLRNDRWYFSVMAKKSTINKSAVTGRIVSKAAAAKSPSTTYKQTVMKGAVKKRAK